MLKTVSTYINVIGALVYKGTWNAATNNPFLQSSVGDKGDYYVVSQAGTTNLNGITDWQVNDIAVFNGAVWEKIDTTDAVLSVNGQTGVVVLNAANVGAVANTVNVIAGTGLAGGGALTANVTLDLSNTAVAPGSYGSATQVSQVTIDAQGRVTSAANVSIAISNSAVSGLGTMSTQNANSVAITGGSVDNATLANANITSLAATFPNNYLSNSSVTLGSTTVALGSTATNLNALSLSNVSITSGSATLANVTVTANLYANLATSNTAVMADPSMMLAPEGYITVVINGTNKKIPYYGA